MPETIELCIIIYRNCISDSGNINKRIRGYSVHVFIDVMISEFVLKTLFFVTFTNTFNR